ncbi:proto-oncogene tyrosine-protein kinase ROS isoform X3 [Sipha flava]|uniref:Tyrosine-protein kinase receptor n=1 Tax=Sipha flava TaxID=143950 RepID=A0A8B8FPD7_9HEMI|nr:proto-oncogene tyrosine-protein kinase ROS isoform X3 [Sipha flava]
MADRRPILVLSSILLLLVTCPVVNPATRLDPQKELIRLECTERCGLQNETNKHGELICGADCVVNQCNKGCALWNEALSSNCSKVCDKLNANYITQSKLYCIAGCNNAITLYFQQIQSEIGPLPPPSLVPDSLSDKSLMLQWKGIRRKNFKYKVQWKLENNPETWQYCRKESWNNDSIIKLDNLRPYTNYQFRIVLLLAWSGVMQLMVSESSVVISTHASKVPPSMSPEIVRTIPADSSISVTWNAIPFPLAPILSYHLTIQEPTKGYTVFKEILTGKENETEHFYMFRNLESAKNYSISLAARNEYGVGPETNQFVKTLPTSIIRYTPEPINLFLVSTHDIFVKTKELIDSPISLYFTNWTIYGVSMDISKNITYISDSSGSLLSLVNNKTYVLLTTKKEILMDLTIDWLNNHLYILILSTINSDTKVYSIKKFDLEQKKMFEVVSGFDYKPFQIEVDPCNGYLFWTTKVGLYRLDLNKKVNNLKMEMSSMLILQNKNIGPFVIDYLNFCLLVLFQKSNTIMSVSLDGQDVTDIRNNTETALFEDAITLTNVNGSFYWSNGSVLMGEEYSVNEQKYYQHIYPTMNYSYNFILSNFTDRQPVPLPRSPPQSLQAITTSNKLKATWQVPHLLSGQGRNSWQGWSYRFSISFENETNWKNIDVNKTEIVIDSLTSSTNYVLKVAAYSSSGQGPWSSEFVVKTLNHNVSVLWGNAQQILISDIMGDYIQSISLDENDKTIKNSSLNDVAWYEDCVYYVVNSSKINWLNLTSHQNSTLEGINSVQSIAIDWLGRKIYWADPSKQLILRENLFGGQREILLVSDIAKELKVESVGGYLYWSTGFSVKSSKLNGKEQQIYYSADYFSGKKVMSLAVDSVGRWVYWILRENDKSKLFRAPTAEKLKDFVPNHVKEFDNLYTQGPLFYVDCHLLWLQNGNDIMMSDTDGQYPAIIRAMNLNGIQTFSVLDPYAHPKPKGLETNVIPEEVDIKMIKVNPIAGVYEIIWEPVKNVNHGLVSYTVKVLEKEDLKGDSLFDTPNTRVLVDSTPLEISIKASTVWGSSDVVTIYTPIPSEPTDIRIFSNFSYNNLTRDIILQHSLIENITYYEIVCYRQVKDSWEVCLNQVIKSTNTRTIWPGLPVNSDIFFKIRACSMAGCSGWTQDIILNQTFNILKFNAAIVYGSKIIIFHLNKQNSHQVILQTNSPVTSLTLNDLEDVVFWTNSKTIFSSPINKSIHIKIYSILKQNIKIENILFDWISKTLFWCEVSDNQSTIMAMNIEKNKEAKVLMVRSNRIFPYSAVLSEGLFIWIEKISDSNENNLLKSNINGTDIETFVYSSNSNCNCTNLYPFDNVLTLYMSNNGKARLLWVESKHRNIVVSDINGCKCSIIFLVNSTSNLTSLAIDKHYIYWTTNKSMCSIPFKEFNDIPMIKDDTSLYCINNVTSVYTIDGLSESNKKPCPPGFPQVNQTLPSVYMVYWEKSESRVKSYSLERLIITEIRNKRSLNLNITNWTTVYNGPESHWYMSDVKPDVIFKFRVKAENHHGRWSEYRTSDEPFNPQFQVETLKNEDISWKIIITGFILICLFLTMLIKYSGWDTFNTKGPMRPDVELGRLREMPQRPTFCHAVNVGYQGVILYQKKDNNELPSIKREQITLTKRLGSGAFGEVFEGKVKDIIRGETEIRVAIKSLKEGATQSEVVEFIKEAKLMNNFKHRHILQLIGVCLDNDPNFIIMELMEEGDLLSYLRKNRPTSTTKSSLNLIDLISMCIDVAEGCSYLEQMHFIHRDLACRNCLVSSSNPKERIIKIGDFGLARNIYTHDYYRKEGEALLPVRWMSPESLVDGVFTSQSDVWAFGVLLWEIMSLGQQPYPGLSNINVMYHVQHGGRLEKPINCPKTLYNLMLKCWNVEPEIRPRFEFCLKVLKSYKAMPLDYVNISHDHSQSKLSHPISNEGYEIPVKITNNEYLELCSDTCEYLDLSRTPTVHMVDGKDSEAESIPEDIHLLYCNMSAEQL